MGKWDLAGGWMSLGEGPWGLYVALSLPACHPALGEQLWFPNSSKAVCNHLRPTAMEPADWGLKALRP